MQTSPNYFAATLERILEQKKWTKTRLAREMDIANSSISRWLSGSSPSTEKLRQLAAVLGVDVKILIEPDDAAAQASAEEFGRLAEPCTEHGPKTSVVGKENAGSSDDAKRSLSDTSSHPVAVRAVPIISWAHAGQAAAYEELPKSWQDQTYTTCRDPKAFALSVEGDSMSPHCLPGDLVVLMPSEEARNGCMVVAKLTDDGIILRRFTKLANAVRLSAYNPMYPPADYPHESFLWIYPVHSTVRREWS